MSSITISKRATALPINYYAAGPVQMVQGDVNNNHSQVTDDNILQNILHFSKENVDISKHKTWRIILCHLSISQLL